MNRNTSIGKSKFKVRQFFMLLMVALIFISGMLPSLISVGDSNKSDAIVEPIISSDLEGESEKEVSPDEHYDYNINVSLPEDVSNYESMIIVDELDKDLKIKDTSVFVNGETSDAVEVEINEQKITLTLLNDQFEEFAGNSLTLQIATLVTNDADTGDEIENIAKVIVNNDVALETDSVYVNVIDTEEKGSKKTVTTESEDVEEKGSDNDDKNPDQTDEQDIKRKTRDTEEKELANDDKNLNIVDEKDTTKKARTEEKIDSSNQTTFNSSITFNDTDFYSVTYDGEFIQYEGGINAIDSNGGETWEKGKVITNHYGTNGLALNNEALFFSSEGKLHKLSENGSTTEVGELHGNTAVAGFSGDDKTYVYVTGGANNLYINTYNVETHEETRLPINNITENQGLTHTASGDLVVDADGFAWHLTWVSGVAGASNLVRINPDTGDLDRIIPITYSNGTQLSTTGALAFLENGKLVLQEVQDGNNEILIANPATGIVESTIGNPPRGSNDYASRIHPTLMPDLSLVKSVDIENEVGPNDVLTYTLEVNNQGNIAATDTRVKDSLPEGTTYVPESTMVNGELRSDIDGESPLFEGMSVNSPGVEEGVLFVGDNNKAVIQFKVKVNGREEVVNEVVNVAYGSATDIEEFESNEVTNKVVYKDPLLESTKSVVLEEKAEENNYNDNPNLEEIEVGDTIRYTITTKNTIEESIVENLVITDEIPDGLTYVDESLKVDGESVTDAVDNDAGHVVDGQITGTFGDVLDTEEHVVSFLVTVDQGQARKIIENIATVGGDNTDEPDKPRAEVEIHPREPDLEAKKTADNQEEDKEKFEVGDTVVYTIQGRNIVSDSFVKDFVITDELPEGLEFIEDSLKVSHDGDASFDNGSITANFGDVGDTDWRTVTFEAMIQSGQADKTINNVATVQGKNYNDQEIPPLKPEEKVTVDYKDPSLTSNKIAELEAKADGNTDMDNPEVGDTIRYTITTQNTVEDSIIENLSITDEVPEGLSYVSGSLEIDGELVTDVEDDDAGHVIDDQISGIFGDITDTNKHSITFLVTVDAGQAGKTIENIATVSGSNIGDPDKPREEVKIYPREPVLQGEKLSENKKKGKENFEVGDTIIYTIKGRNIVSDSLVEDFVITDELPDGLEFIEDSLKVSHDAESTFDDGSITVNFGDVEDTEWRTITFEAIIKPDQSGKEIKNIATVDGTNIDDPQKLENKIVIDEIDKVNKLPKTATNMFNMIVLGLGLMIVGILVQLFRRRNA